MGGLRQAYESILLEVLRKFPSPKLAGVTLRRAITATRNDWGVMICARGTSWAAPVRKELEIVDRVGGGDGFASGLVYGLLEGDDPKRAVELGATHGALAMTAPGDTSMAALKEVEIRAERSWRSDHSLKRLRGQCSISEIAGQGGPVRPHPVPTGRAPADVAS